MNTIIENQPRKQSAAEVERPNTKNRNKNKEVTSKPSKRGCFVNKTTRKSQATSNTYI